GLQLRVSPGEELSGMVEAAGGAAKLPPVRLEPEERFLASASQPAVPAKDGSFRVSDIFPVKYRVHLDPMPENGYIKAISTDTGVVAGDVVDFSSGVHGARLKIALGLDAGEISGRILGRDGQPLASALVMVGVWKEGQKGDP